MARLLTLIDRSSSFLLLSGVAVALFLTGCRAELYDMEYGEPLEKSSFFEDGRMTRLPVEGTVARGQLNDNELLYTGKLPGQSASDGESSETGAGFSSVFPMEVTKDLIHRGQERYDIFCTPCHGKTGRGNGIIVQRGMQVPPSFHVERLREAPAGYFFDVMTNGFGVMYGYASRIKAEDRWAIVAYIRALQKSQLGVTEGAPEASEENEEQGQTEESN